MAKEQTVRMLLGNSDERLNNIVEKLVRDVFADVAVIQAVRTAKVREFTRQGCEQDFDLIIVMPDGLKPEYRPQGSLGPVGETARAITTITQTRASRILAFSHRPDDESALLEAGAEHVIGIPFKCDEVKAAVRRMVTLAPAAEEPPAVGWSFGGELLRGWRRFAQT
jgi:hypothetical protein